MRARLLCKLRNANLAKKQVLAEESGNYLLNVAKLAQMTVKTAFTGGCFFINFLVKLIHCELAVGITAKKTDECFPARCLISLFSHLFSP